MVTTWTSLNGAGGLLPPIAQKCNHCCFSQNKIKGLLGYSTPSSYCVLVKFKVAYLWIHTCTHTIHATTALHRCTDGPWACKFTQGFHVLLSRSMWIKKLDHLHDPATLEFGRRLTNPQKLREDCCHCAFVCLWVCVRLHNMKACHFLAATDSHDLFYSSFHSNPQHLL